MSTNESDVGVAEHDGDIRIYDVQNTEVWIESDISVDEVLDDTDSNPTYPHTNQGHHPDEDGDN